MKKIIPLLLLITCNQFLSAMLKDRPNRNEYITINTTEEKEEVVVVIEKPETPEKTKKKLTHTELCEIALKKIMNNKEVQKIFSRYQLKPYGFLFPDAELYLLSKRNEILSVDDSCNPPKKDYIKETDESFNLRSKSARIFARGEIGEPPLKLFWDRDVTVIAPTESELEDKDIVTFFEKKIREIRRKKKVSPSTFVKKNYTECCTKTIQISLCFAIALPAAIIFAILILKATSDI